MYVCMHHVQTAPDHHGRTTLRPKQSPRSVPSPSASNVESASSAASPGPEQQDASQSRSRRHRRSHHHHRHKKKTCAGVDSHGCQQARVFPDAPSSGEDDRAHRSSAERPRSEGRGRAGRKGVGGAVAPALGKRWSEMIFVDVWTRKRDGVVCRATLPPESSVALHEELCCSQLLSPPTIVYS